MASEAVEFVKRKISVPGCVVTENGNQIIIETPDLPRGSNITLITITDQDMREYRRLLGNKQLVHRAKSISDNFTLISFDSF